MQNQKILSGILHSISSDMQEVLQNNTNILEKWNNLTPIQRNEWICWVTIVKKEETRQKHISRMLEELELGKKTPCCWPGCPHRNPNSQKWFNKTKN
jgi:hypothetical protein